MAKRLITKTPWSLPPSTIYLDDLKEIEVIVRSCFDATDPTPGFLYEVDEEFLVDSIEELEAHQGHARALRVFVGESSSAPIESRKPGTLVLNLSKYSSDISAPYGSKKSEGDFHYRVKNVFELRKRPLLSSLESFPRWHGIDASWFFMLWALILFVAMIVITRMGQGLSKMTLLFAVISCSFLTLLTGVASMSMLVSGLGGRFRINLYYLRQSQLKKSESRKSFLGKVGWMLLGGLASQLFQWVGGLLKH
jgi:hypothetical protein